jgi:DNA-directed RNA polymerase sigma subunit (sigma70/sigma32)
MAVPGRFREPLPPSVEHDLIAAAATGDAAARLELLEAYEPVIAAIARRYSRNPGVSRDELMQEGAVGLLRALERYDLRRGTAFWAYASWWVRQAMQEIVSELSGTVVLSDRALRGFGRLLDARERDVLRAHFGIGGPEQTLQEIGGRWGVSAERVRQIEQGALEKLRASAPGR